MVVGRPPTDDPLPRDSWERHPAGSRYAGFCACRCPAGVSQSWPPPFPPSSSSSLPAGCIHFSFQTCLGVCLGPTAIKLDQQPLTCLPCAEGLVRPRQALGSSREAPGLCCSGI